MVAKLRASSRIRGGAEGTAGGAECSLFALFASSREVRSIRIAIKSLSKFRSICWDFSRDVMPPIRGPAIISVRPGCLVSAMPASAPVNTSNAAKQHPAHISANHGLEVAALDLSLNRFSDLFATDTKSSRNHSIPDRRWPGLSASWLRRSTMVWPAQLRTVTFPQRSSLMPQDYGRARGCPASMWRQVATRQVRGLVVRPLKIREHKWSRDVNDILNISLTLPRALPLRSQFDFKGRGFRASIAER